MDDSFLQVKLVSWNIQTFGKSKSDVEINFIANTLGAYDITNSGSGVVTVAHKR
jgi:hypothetical protein